MVERDGGGVQERGRREEKKKEKRTERGRKEFKEEIGRVRWVMRTAIKNSSCFPLGNPHPLSDCHTPKALHSCTIFLSFLLFSIVCVCACGCHVCVLQCQGPEFLTSAERDYENVTLIRTVAGKQTRLFEVKGQNPGLYRWISVVFVWVHSCECVSACTQLTVHWVMSCKESHGFPMDCPLPGSPPF